MMSILLGIFTIVALIIILGALRTWQTQNSPGQKLFFTGKTPKPDGFYKGSIKNLKTPWQGKKFEIKSATGINLVNNKEIFPFKTYVGKGLQDKDLDVLKIDYDIPKNPFWVRPILDEVVEIKPRQFLGKVHLRMIPGLPFTLGYFKLEK